MAEAPADISDARESLCGADKAALDAALAQAGVPDKQIKMRRQQIWSWLYTHGVHDFDAMHNVAKAVRAGLAENFSLARLDIAQAQYSDDGTRKWLCRLHDGHEIDTVYIPEAGRGTLCVSSQVGCTLACRFCHTGTQRLIRNLTTAEITGQLVAARDALDDWPTGTASNTNTRKITNIVMMGMGEPLLNFTPVVDAMNLMMDDNAYGLSKRKVTLSTSGIVPKIDALSKVSDVALTISLHAPNDLLRNELVPINKKYPIQELLDSVKRYVASCDDKRVTTIEYILIDGINDDLSHAKELSVLLEQLPSKINLIPFNTFEGSEYLKPSGNRVKRFQEYLQDKGYVTTIRSTRGDDIMAACGQLVGQVNDKTRRKERAQKNKIQIKTI